MKERDQLAAHMDDLARRASKTGVAGSKFLTPAEKQLVRQRFALRQDILLKLDGGYTGAEREIAVFIQPEFGIYHADDCLSALKLEYRPQDPVSHRDVLGSLMALGIERPVIGDILCGSGQTALVCLKSMAAYLTEHLQKIGRVGVNVSAVALSDLPEKHEELAVKTATVASLRLDAVLCAIFRISRSRASELVSTQKINLNHMPVADPSQKVPEGAILSVKGMGRAVLISTDGFSKKGRIFIKFGLY
ncbi:MAG: RNA-binding protein [Peptococcaceae bacterium]|nr:RNA-binding protein [Peptococcaceae bacterium]